MVQKQPPEVIGVLKNFTKFTGKHLCHSLSFNKVTCLRPATLSKKRLWHSCFPVNFAKFLKTPFLQNNSERVLLMVNIIKNYTIRCCYCDSKEYTLYLISTF